MAQKSKPALCGDCGVYVGRNTRSRTFYCKPCSKKRPKRKHPEEYSAWSSMKDRCLNSSSTSYQHYGGRGIGICDEWVDSFSSFLLHMGKRPPGLSLERIDVNGDYGPGNCVWADAKAQANNRTSNRIITIKGVSKTLSIWAEQSPVSASVIRQRLRLGWSDYSAVFTPGVPKTDPRNTGERNPNSKLTKDVVAKMRDMWRRGEKQSHIARKYGIGQSQVSRIVRGERWV